MRKLTAEISDVGLRLLTQMLNDQSAPPADPTSLLNSAQSVANAPGATEKTRSSPMVVQFQLRPNALAH